MDIVERFNVSSTKLSFDNWIYVSNHLNANFDGLPFYGDQSLITGQQIYHINDNIIERLNNGLIVSVYTNIM